MEWASYLHCTKKGQEPHGNPHPTLLLSFSFSLSPALPFFSGLFLIDLMQVLHNRSAWSLYGYGKTNSGNCFMWQMSEAVKPSWGTQEASQNTHKSSCMFPGICKATRMSKPVPRPRKNLGGPQSRQLTLECWRCAPNSEAHIPFKEILSIHLPTTLTKQKLQWPHITKNADYMISPESPSTNSSNTPWQGKGDLIFRVITWY